MKKIFARIVVERYIDKYQIFIKNCKKDIIADGYRTIVALCDNDERDFYREKGYRVGKKCDQDVLIV